MEFLKLTRLATLSFLALASTLTGVNVLPVEIGGPVQISPTPGPSNPDPVLDNLVLVMDNHYQPPYYPGGAPDYLSQIYYFSDHYIGHGLAFDPFDSRTIHFTIGQNFIRDRTDTFYYANIPTNTFSTSNDKGTTWNYGPPIEQIIPLGGTISQMVNASVGPGLFYEYAKNGRMTASGWGFFDMIANFPNAIPNSGFLFTHSEDNGVSWATPEIVVTNFGDGWFNTEFAAHSPLWFEFYTTIDPSNPQVIHCCTAVVNDSPVGLPAYSYFSSTDGPTMGPSSAIYYFNSQDGGKTFSCPQIAYDTANDPIWKKEHLDPNYTYDREYFKIGSFIGLVGHPVVLGNETIGIPLRRLYPKIGDLMFLLDYVHITTDQGLVLSRDNGKTWSKSMGATDQFMISPEVYDPGFWNPGIPQNVNGYEVTGYTHDAGLALSRDAYGVVQYSASTGRIYMTYQNCHPDYPIYDQDVRVAVCQLILSSSDDLGETWSPAVQINRTPSNINPRAQQAFGNSSAISLDGWYVVSYYDFRNWALNGGVPGEDLLTTPLLTDAWLAVYRETEDPRGGSTGVGLDFVGEICLTPGSFDARIIMTTTAVPYVSPYLTGTPEGMPLAFNKDNELFVVYSVQHPITSSDIDTNGYKGMTIDKNSYQTLYLRRFKFPKPTNQ